MAVRKPQYMIVAGQGALAQQLQSTFSQNGLGDLSFDFTHESLIDWKGTRCVLVHAGSGRQLEKCLDECGKLGFPIIQASTGQELPDDVPVPVIDAPNLALPIVNMLVYGFPILGEILGNISVSIVESHQSSKKSVPGTARSIAEVLGVSADQIESVRCPSVQRVLGVPEEHLDGHGYHWVNFSGLGVDVSVTTSVNGREAYGLGALVLGKKLFSIWGDSERHALENGVYSLKEFLER